MLNNHVRCWRWAGFGLIVLFAAASVSFSAEREMRQRPSRTDAQTPRPEDARKEQLRKEAQVTFPEIEKQLKQILEKVNKNQKPSTGLIKQATAALEKNKRFSVAYEDNQRAGYMLLQAWTSFYQGNSTEAMNWSMRACKLDETSLDAWISQAVFCLLNDKRPMMPRVKTPQQNRQETGETRRPRRQDVEGMMAEMQTAVSELTLRKGTLEFDLSMLRNGAIKEQFEKIDYKKEWGSDIEYEDGKDTLCLLFWQSEEAPAAKTHDANDVSPAAAKKNVPNELDMPGIPDMMGMPGMSATSDDSQKLSIRNQQTYFERLFDACQEHPQVKFVQINTDRPEIAKKVAEQLLNDPKAPIAVPLVFASQTGAEVKDYAGVCAAGPIMIVVDKDKKLKYAGPAADFAPAFILTAMTGVELDLEKMSQPKPAAVAPAPGLDPNNPEGMMPVSPQPSVSPPVDMPRPDIPIDLMLPGGPMPAQPKPAADPNAPSSATGVPAEKPKAAPLQELSLEDEIKAQNLLREGELHIKESRKLRGKNPGKGIEACREVLKKYPNTEFAGQARELLRIVPERYKQQYNITDKELGY